MSANPIYAVIMAGGSGTRFWPASRRLQPKQLLPLGGELPLLREAVDRVVPLCGAERVFIATGSHLVEQTLAAVPGLRREQLLVEPVARNTAPCIGWAAASIARRHPDAVVMALPSDPHIQDVARYQQTLEVACAAAEAGAITTIGIQPTHPETGYGYIEANVAAAAGDTPALVDVARFVEKPDLERAKTFLESGRFFWNAGMFFFRAGDMLRAIEQHMPELAKGLAQLDDAAAAGREAEVLPEVFGAMPALSIDHGVMEHLAGMKMVVGDFGWSDLGSWLAASELADKDAANNSAPDAAVLIDSLGCHVVSNGDKLVALVGVEDLVVVDTPDALLVVKRDQAQRVREVVAALKARGDDQLV